MKKQLTKSVAYHNWKIWTFPLHLPVEIISDSLSVLTMLEKGPCSQTHVLGNHIWNAVADIAQFTTGGIHFAHVFSHAGVECNDEADELAKEAWRVRDDAAQPNRVPLALPSDVARSVNAQLFVEERNICAPALARFVPRDFSWKLTDLPMSVVSMIHRLLVGVDYWMGGIDFIGAPVDIQQTTTKCPLCNDVFVNRHQKEDPVDRPGMKHVEHPTIHCMTNCKHAEAVKLREEHFGPEVRNHSPARLFTDLGKVIAFYIERKELAREKTTLQRRREN